MVKILAAQSILNSSGASPGATKIVAALVLTALVTALYITNIMTYNTNISQNNLHNISLQIVDHFT